MSNLCNSLSILELPVQVRSLHEPIIAHNTVLSALKIVSTGGIDQNKVKDYLTLKVFNVPSEAG